jgi:hypothetical protein
MFDSIQIVEKRDWQECLHILRNEVSLNGDATIFPYKNAQIEYRIIDPYSVKPISLYALKDNLATQHQIHQLFQDKYQLNTLDLPPESRHVLFNVEGESGNWLIAPPIVEESSVDGGIPVLIDGEHRFLLAHELQQPIGVIWISQVPTQFPTVAYPVEWSEVKIYDQVPSLVEKRKYRYPQLSDFPDISSFSQQPVAEDNYLYFFYRNLNPLCNTGVRWGSRK